MKTGILSFHNTVNYGAELQLFALSRVVSSLGHEVEVINYRNEAIERSSNPHERETAGLKNLAWRALKYQRAVKKWDAFQQFQTSYLKMSPEVLPEALLEALKRYDSVVVGSDQIWNFDLTHKDPTYFLPFKNPPFRKIAYAASFGKSAICAEEEGVVGPWIRDFDHVSMRETSGADVLSERFHLQVPSVLDPTMLLGADEWASLSEDRLLDSPYVAAYGIGPSRKQVFLESKNIGEALGLPVVWFSSSTYPLFGVKRMDTIGPQGFLSIIENADYVVTDSFHGTCFSIIFNKRFRTVLESTASPNNRNSRICDLLNNLDMSHVCSETIFEGFDWDRVNEKHEKMRAESLRCLVCALADQGKTE